MSLLFFTPRAPLPTPKLTAAATATVTATATPTATPNDIPRPANSLSFLPRNPSSRRRTTFTYIAPLKSSHSPRATDEWGEEEDVTQAGTEPPSEPDPPKEEADDEWGHGGTDAVGDYVGEGDGAPSSAAGVVERKEEGKDGSLGLEALKRCLLDTVYGSELGFRTSGEVRAEVLELVNQLEAKNPTPEPVQSSGLLDGNWVLVYTASSELLPLLAAGALPLVNVDKISQSVDSTSLTIVNSFTLSSPFASFSFGASAAFEIRSPSRIQVEFKEGTFQPPDIKPTIELPESLDVFGQNINLMPVQQSLGPLQEAVTSLSRTISGQPPLKVPIPGERTRSWLLVTYLDQDLRISRGDGGLFVLVKEGSSLLS